MLSSSWDGVEAGLPFATIMGIVAQWTEEESIQAQFADGSWKARCGNDYNERFTNGS
jgi:hypothetical protein